jgi:hypothetical protein
MQNLSPLIILYFVHFFIRLLYFNGGIKPIIEKWDCGKVGFFLFQLDINNIKLNKSAHLHPLIFYLNY